MCCKNSNLEIFLIGKISKFWGRDFENLLILKIYWWHSIKILRGEMTQCWPCLYPYCNSWWIQAIQFLLGLSPLGDLDLSIVWASCELSPRLVGLSPLGEVLTGPLFGLSPRLVGAHNHSSPIIHHAAPLIH